MLNNKLTIFIFLVVLYLTWQFGRFYGINEQRQLDLEVAKQIINSLNNNQTQQPHVDFQ